MKIQPVKQSALHFSLIENGANMINKNSWNMVSYFDQTENELNAVKDSLAIADMSHLSKFKIQTPHLDDFLASKDLKIQIGQVVNENVINDPGKHIHTTTRISIDELWVNSTSCDSSNEIEAFYENDIAGVELFDMTSAFTGIRILGPNAPLFLSELTDLNIGLDELRNLRSAQSMFLQIYGLIIRNDLINLPTYELFVDRSYALYAFESIMKLAARHNGKLVGTKCMSKLGAVT